VPSSAVRISIDTAAAWIDRNALPLAPEIITLADAVGRVLASAAEAMIDLPSFDRASIDGLAVRAEDVAGASAYNPLSVQVVPAGTALPPQGGAFVDAADALPAASDAIVPLAYVEDGATGSHAIIEAVATGHGVERRASQIARGATLFTAGREIHPHDLGLLVAAGSERLAVTRRPRVACYILRPSGGSSGAAVRDTNGPLLRALIERDGGLVAECRLVDRSGPAVGEALARAVDMDVIVLVGGSGPGANDNAAAAVAATNELVFHGLALRPGETAGLGRSSGGVPIFLLPGPPASCLWAYEFLAGRAIRRRGARHPGLPFAMRRMTAGRKIVSDIGMTEIWPVRDMGQDRFEGVAPFAEAGLAAFACSDGFVIIPEGREGIAQGTEMHVYRRDGRDRDRHTDTMP
jgi:molybdopterin molybdotransferase